MAIIPQTMFSWKGEIDRLGDLERLRAALEALPGGQLMEKIERARGRGRDGCPARAMWNLLIAGYVFGHAR